MNRDRLLQILGTIHDIAAAAVSFYCAYLSYYGIANLAYVPGIHEKAVMFIAIAMTCFFMFSLNRGSWRYASIPELVAIIKASGLAVIGFTLVLFLLSRGANLPRSVPILMFIFLVVGLGGSRLAYRLTKDRGYLPFMTRPSTDAGPMRDIVMLGSNQNAESFIRAVHRSAHSPLRIHGIIDERSRIGLSIQDIGVIGDKKSLPAIVSRLKHRGINLSELVVTDHDLSSAEISDLVTLANASGLKISQIPNLADTANLDEKILEPNPIEISDLLGREEVRVDTQPIAQLIESRTLMITGAGGSIGSELARQVASFTPKRLVLIDVSEHLLYLVDSDIREKFPHLNIVSKIADIRDMNRIDQVFRIFRPDVVLHAAALKHVPLMESNVVESMKTNILGTRNVANAAVAHNVGTFVLISTDKAVRPTNIMGATKRAAEAYCQSLDLAGTVTKFKTVRFGNVLGSNGSVVPKFEKQIARGGPVTVTHPDMVRYFMTIPEAVKLVLRASGHGMHEHGDRGRILVLEMGNRVRIADLATKMIELAGFKPHVDIEIVYTDLRPGEKLYEELLDPDEETDVVKEQGYMLAYPRLVNKTTLEKAVALIETAVIEGDEETAIFALRMIVPEYTPPLRKPSNVLSLSEAKKKLA